MLLRLSFQASIADFRGRGLRERVVLAEEEASAGSSSSDSWFLGLSERGGGEEQVEFFPFIPSSSFFRRLKKKVSTSPFDPAARRASFVWNSNRCTESTSSSNSLGVGHRATWTPGGTRERIPTACRGDHHRRRKRRPAGRNGESHLFLSFFSRASQVPPLSLFFDPAGRENAVTLPLDRCAVKGREKEEEENAIK